MGLLVEGKWHDDEYLEEIGGADKVKMSSCRDWITKDGEKFEDRETFPAEKDRYHLYISYSCPWASRALMAWKILGLEDAIDVSFVNPIITDEGWDFKKYPGSTEDKVNGFKYLREVYTKSDKNYTGRVTVPVLYDKKREKIINNESSEILRILNDGFSELSKNKIDLYPEELREEIDEINEMILEGLNSGVYKVGFAKEQAQYEKEVDKVFETLDKVEEILGRNKYLVGEKFTEADIRLFVTLIRFDPVYYNLFKCNLRPITSYPNIWEYTKRIYNMDGVKDTVNMDHIKTNYYKAEKFMNKNGIVPKGPILDYSL